MAYPSINHSTIYYPLHGYKLIQSPWLVSSQTSAITRPTDRSDFVVKPDRVLVGSGEQSFLQLISDNNLDSKQSYVTVTPCFRDEKEDHWHKTYFLKTELIYFEKHDPSDLHQQHRFKSKVEEMSNHICLNFYKKYLPAKRVKISNDSDLHFEQYDIVSDISLPISPSEGEEVGVELGSYGIRINKGIIWAYGTGCAEPRLSQAVNMFQKPGYHLDLIPKTKNLGSVEKIVEEYEEFLDAIKQETTVMALVELSDLIGAIGMYVEHNYNMTLDDLVKFSQITKRAFVNGRRV